MGFLYSKNDYNRVIPIEESPHRNAFRRDNGRLIHSAVFRRLQGKTQLFPNYESDFFRNRLTHSIEVAQIAKGLAEQLNNSNEYFLNNPIDLDLVETASLAHDLGHPPFGHNGEKALDDIMKSFGGFEGNAQTLRILSKLEKKNTLEADYLPVKNGEDRRCGLNLCFRSLASILKYDNEIPMHRKMGESPEKGYYYTEKQIVRLIKKNILGDHSDQKLKSVECQLMDIADDIAYSTYDLEDAFKAEFLCPLGILASDPSFIEKVAKAVSESFPENSMDADEVRKILGKTYELFDDEVFQSLNAIIQSQVMNGANETKSNEPAVRYASTYASDLSKRICTNGYLRTRHTSSLVHEFMEGLEVECINEKNPILSKVRLKNDVRKKVEVLKRFTYYSVIESPRLKIAEFRGYDIIKEIFEILSNHNRKGYSLLPEDFRDLYYGFSDVALKKRVICDFIAGMTDRYAVEFYARLKSENPQTIFKPF